MKPVLFSTRRYASLRRIMLGFRHFEDGQVNVRIFPDGERYQRIQTPVAGRPVVLLGGTISDEDTLELYDLACGLVHYGAQQLMLILPWYGYATMERAGKWGEVVTAKTRATLLSGIPHAGSGNLVFLLDLHSEGIPHYFEGGMRPVHLYARPVILEAARELGGKDLVLACTDAGRAKWVESLANDLGVPASFVFKRRLDGETTEVTAVSAQVAGRNVVIYDDMIRTGGSLINAARAYKDAGAKQISALTTHGLFPGDAIARIKASGLFEKVVCTDSHPRALEVAAMPEAQGFVSVRTVAGLLADEVYRALEGDM